MLANFEELKNIQLKNSNIKYNRQNISMLSYHNDKA